MTILPKYHNFVLQRTSGFFGSWQPSRLGKRVEDQSGAVEEMKHELQAWKRSKVNYILFKLWSWKAWEEMKVGWTALSQDDGELCQDLRQALAIPDNCLVVHQSCNQELNWAGVENLTQDWRRLIDYWLLTLWDHHPFIVMKYLDELEHKWMLKKVDSTTCHNYFFSIWMIILNMIYKWKNQGWAKCSYF